LSLMVVWYGIVPYHRRSKVSDGNSKRAWVLININIAILSFW